MLSKRAAVAAGLAVSIASLGSLTACSAGGSQATPPAPAVTVTVTATPTPSPSTPTSPTTSPPTPPASPSPTTPPAAIPATPSNATPPGDLGTVPPPWLGKRVLPVTAGGYGEIGPTPKALRDRRFTLPDTVPMLPGSGFASRITSPAPADVIARSTWVQGCPVKATDLAWVRLTFWGFDDARHTGELLVNASVAKDMVKVFRELYADRFPLEEMRITTKAEQTAPPTGDGNDTGAFNCRPKAGQTSGFSQHAYGLAIDVNPFQNPYVNGALVLPERASAYVDRTNVRPGMILPGGPVVQAFARIGWTWGGTWHSLKDLQHFSQNGT